MNRKQWMAGIIALFSAMSVFGAGESSDIAVGIYFNPIVDEPHALTYGFEGTKWGLEENGFENVKYVKSFDPEELKDIQVVFVPATPSFSQKTDIKSLREKQRQFVEKGGGIILSQESVGWRGPFTEMPIFPEIGRGVAFDGKNFGPVQMTPLQVVDKSHPITKDLPAEFQMQYDAAPLKPGEKGKVLVKLADDAYVRAVKVKLDNMAAVIVGEYGKGRVVLIGPVIGLTRQPREMESAPKDGELQLLLNSVRWANGKAK